MKRLTAFLASAAIVISGLVGATPAAASSWDFPNTSFTIDDGFGTQATITVQNLRITDGTTARGYLRLDGAGAACTTSAFTGLDAYFFVGSYEPCSGTVSFSVDSTGALAVSTALIVKGHVFSGTATGSAQGTKYPPEITCTATSAGPSDVMLSWTDSGSAATQYDITASPALPQPVSISSGPNQVTITGLQPGTRYDFTLATVGPWTGATTCNATTDVLTGPVGTVSYGAITGTTAQDAEREYSLDAGSPPPGWSLEWLVGGRAITPHGAQRCGTTSSATPQWTHVGSSALPGAIVTIAPQCTVGAPVLDPGSHVTGGTVTVNYSLPAPFEAGTIVWAMYQLTGTSTPLGPISLGSPPAGGQAGSASFPVAGLKPPIGVRVQLYATNGPITSTKTAWQLIPGETATAPTGPNTPSNAQPGAQTGASTDGTDAASTGGAGASSGSDGAGPGINPCLAPNGTLYVDMAGSVGSTFTMAPNTFGMAAPQSFAVTGGSLPPGVRLDGTFGVISGTPERSNGGAGPVQITTRWTDGSIRASDLNIAVDDPYHAVNYPNRVIGSVGRPLTIGPLPINAQGTTRYAVVCGALPAGLAFNGRTGIISGTPTVIDERPVPLRIRMTDGYGWVDSSLLLVVNAGVTPWLAYPEFMQIGIGRKVSIVPTRTGLPPVSRYWISQGLPAGLAFNKRTGTITGASVVHDGIIYEPTIMAIGADGKPVASTWVSITIVKPAVPMRVLARSATKSLNRGKTVLVTRVKHPSFVALTARVRCTKCSFTFNRTSGRLVVTTRKGTKKVTVTIVGQPSTSTTKATYAGHTWTRTWAPVHPKK